MTDSETGSDESAKLPLFTPEDIPRGRRQALADALRERRSAIGRTFSCAAVLMLVSVMGVVYGAASAAAWIRPANPVLGSILAVCSAGFFASSVYLTLVLRDLATGIKDVPEQLRRLAAAEHGLEREISLANEVAELWNSIADELRDENGSALELALLSSTLTEVRRQQTDLRERIERLGPTDA